MKKIIIVAVCLMIAALPLSVSAAGEYVPGNPRWSGYQNQVQWDRPAGAASGDSYLLIADGKLEAAAERKIPSDGYYFDDGEDGYIVYEVADEAVGDGEKAVAILNGNILATDQAFYQIMYDDISENDLSY